MGDSITINTEAKAALEEAVHIAGGQTALGEKIGKSQAHISQWLRRGRCPAEVVRAIEEATGVSRHRLREDVFGPEPSGPRSGTAESRGATA